MILPESKINDLQTAPESKNVVFVILIFRSKIPFTTPITGQERPLKIVLELRPGPSQTYSRS